MDLYFSKDVALSTYGGQAFVVRETEVKKWYS
jgi:hypothetical protein